MRRSDRSILVSFVCVVASLVGALCLVGGIAAIGFGGTVFHELLGVSVCSTACCGSSWRPSWRRSTGADVTSFVTPPVGPLLPEAFLLVDARATDQISVEASAGVSDASK